MKSEDVLHNTPRRLLLITQDLRIREEGTEQYIRVQHLQQSFSEIHVVLLNQKSHTTAITSERIGTRVWIHPTNSASWWRLGFDAHAIAVREVTFGGQLCADVIVAEDMGEAGVVGYLLSKKYNVPLQLHVYEATPVSRLSFHTLVQAGISQYLVNVVSSIRTETESKRNALIGISKQDDISIELLPRCRTWEEWKNRHTTISLHERYPQFKFIILHISSMCTRSHSREVMLGVSNVLREHSSVGLVIAGSGPCRAQLERQAIALGIQHQVEFEPDSQDMLSLLKTADILVHLSEDADEDDVVRIAGLAKLPMILNTEGIGGRLFTDAESAYLCAVDDVLCIGRGVEGYLEIDQVRTIFSENAFAIMSKESTVEYARYLNAYIETIQQCGELES